MHQQKWTISNPSWLGGKRFYIRDLRLSGLTTEDIAKAIDFGSREEADKVAVSLGWAPQWSAFGWPPEPPTIMEV